jgi:hypothetical protein
MPKRRNAMSSNGQAATTSSPVATDAGKVVQVPDLAVPSNRIYGFVSRYRKEYFEDHSLEWCLDEILNRGMAEIIRQVKTAQKSRENKAAGSLLKEFNLSPAEAKAIMLKMMEQAKLEAQAKAKQPS